MKYPSWNDENRFDIGAAAILEFHHAARDGGQTKKWGEKVEERLFDSTSA